MTTADLIIAGLILVSVPFAVRATWNLWRLYVLDTSRSLLLFGIALAATIATVAASWFGLLTLRRLLGLEAIDWSPPVSGAIAVAVFWIPALFDWIVARIGHRPDMPDNIGRGPS